MKSGCKPTDNSPEDYSPVISYLAIRSATYEPALFLVETWNQHAGGVDGFARSINSVEGWHHAITRPCGPSCQDWNDMQRQKSFLQGVTGVDHMSAKKYRKQNDRVKRAVAVHGRAEILVYLRT